MAHGDALIFLTNITWIFVLFLFVYLFFVVYFLPLFYKKFRIRALVGNVFKLRSAFFLRNVFVSLTFCVDFFRGLFAQLIAYFRSQLFFFVTLSHNKLVIFSNFDVLSGAGLSVNTRNSVFIEARDRPSAVFLRFKR